MIIGIVGAEEAKFTPEGKRRAVALITKLVSDPSVMEVVSGACHLGGVDIWAAEIGRELGKKVTEFPPKTLDWSGGYKPRNLQIARRSDVVHCITVDSLPPSFDGMKFDSCYHCHRNNHVKSGGCWTMKRAKIGMLHVICNGVGGQTDLW